MKEKLSYILAGLIIYSILGIVISYFSFSMINWIFILFWTLSMTLADFFILRNFTKWLSKKQNKHA
ncbi:hypothetical protein [Flavobacterium sp. I3-2]|uniref:hypothetical protein n=1 Tax=Flavobacterium sp. I3-2 TaxID=2748319 RepID=UPI0015AC7FC1|nr:hypothetical protein [Flavobacterium sp. I3-2]